MAKTVAIVDDESDIVELVSIHLKKAGFIVESFGDAAHFLAFLKRTRPAVVVLDLMLPDMDGLEICKQLRQEKATAEIPVIILSAKAEEVDRIVGLEIGADDYVTKPFSPKELVARVKAVLRRHTAVDNAGQGLLTVGRVVIDFDRHEVRARGKTIDVTATEFKILHILAAKPGRVFSRERILDQIWGNEKIVIDRTVDVHINHLREKLGTDGHCIKNIRGVGYKFEL